MTLPLLHRTMIDFERSWWKEGGTKQQAIRARFAMSPARYYKLLAEVIETPDAYAYDPLAVRRLRVHRDRRRAARAASGSPGNLGS